MKGFGVQDEHTARRFGIGGGDGDLAAELIGFVGLAFPDTRGLRGMQGVKFAARWRFFCNRSCTAIANSSADISSRAAGDTWFRFSDAP